MKILITGGSGLLGYFLNTRLSQENEILTVYNNKASNCNGFNSVKLDIGDTHNIKEVFSAFSPGVVIHSAAYSRPEICARLTKEEVYRINVTATAEISKLCSKYKSFLVFTSTDLVYDGNLGGMLKENAIINPVSLYAESKFEAEKVIKNVFDNYIILRTSLLYGIGLDDSVNNFHKMFNNFKNGKPSKLFTDQFRTPLSVINAAEIIEQMIYGEVRGETFNFGGKERVSRAELGDVLCTCAGFDKALIEKISLNDIPDIPQVLDVSLNTDKLNSFGFNQKSIEESIRQILKVYNG